MVYSLRFPERRRPAHPHRRRHELPLYLFRRIAKEHGIALKRTRPYRPQTNGKAERVIQTPLREWAYQRHYDSNDERLADLQVFTEEYNTRRPHMALGRRPPISRLNV